VFHLLSYEWYMNGWTNMEQQAHYWRRNKNGYDVCFHKRLHMTTEHHQKHVHETNLSKSSVHAAWNCFVWKHTKFTGAQNLLEGNCDVTVRFCDWCYQVCSGEVKAVLTYFTDEFTWTLLQIMKMTDTGWQIIHTQRMNLNEVLGKECQQLLDTNFNQYVIIVYQVSSISYLLTYLLHGAESFLRS